eukprot:13718801-Ditylum_brightwellii.AAC.1
MPVWKCGNCVWITIQLDRLLPLATTSPVTDVATRTYGACPQSTSQRHVQNQQSALVDYFEVMNCNVYCL